MGHPYLHMVSNLIAGFSFFGISYFFLLFLIEGEKRFKNMESIFKLLKRSTFLVGNIALVFWLCGLGHIMEAFRMFIEDTTIITIEHWFNALIGLLLCVNLQIQFNKFKKTAN